MQTFIKRETDSIDLPSPLQSHRTPSPDSKFQSKLYPSLHQGSPSPNSQTEIRSHPSPIWGPGHARIWSPAEEQRRIWSPAVTCEEENKLSTNNNTISSSKVVVEVRCGGCGDVTSKFRPDVSRCHNCVHTGSHHVSRTERIFKVNKI
jgi:hypothetical protein